MALLIVNDSPQNLMYRKMSLLGKLTQQEHILSIAWIK